MFAQLLLRKVIKYQIFPAIVGKKMDMWRKHESCTYERSGEKVYLQEDMLCCLFDVTLLLSFPLLCNANALVHPIFLPGGHLDLFFDGLCLDSIHHCNMHQAYSHLNIVCCKNVKKKKKIFFVKKKFSDKNVVVAALTLRSTETGLL